MEHKTYTAFHRERLGVHLYPNEFVVRTMLGSYPRLSMPREYPGKALLDLGFGDGRNLLLFHNLGANVFGVEPDAELCELVRDRAERFGLNPDLRTGTNSAIPFEASFFDYVVASHSIYYVAPNESFDDNVREVARVMKPGGWLVASFPDLDNAVLKNAQEVIPGHWRLTADPFNLRNGSIFRAFGSEREIEEALGETFDTFAFGTFRDDWYGLLVSGFAVACRRRER